MDARLEELGDLIIKDDQTDEDRERLLDEMVELTVPASLRAPWPGEGLKEHVSALTQRTGHAGADALKHIAVMSICMLLTKTNKQTMLKAVSDIMEENDVNLMMFMDDTEVSEMFRYCVHVIVTRLRALVHSTG